MSRKSDVTKTCSKCKQIKSVSDFYLNMTKRDNFNSICKVCQKEVNKKNKKQLKK